MPRPVDLDRLLTHEIEPGATARLTGMVHHADQVGVSEPA